RVLLHSPSHAGPTTHLARRSSYTPVNCWDRGRPARKRVGGAQSFTGSLYKTFALRVHLRAGRPRSQQIT
ncbi:MAG TPA: hypothetical protein VE977_10020, partial [Pyrinomonadaceae bacterium]|nr:hypothetical protein [Pyrinomonadaceae bacterium]